MNLLTEKFFTKRLEPGFTIFALLHYSQAITPLLITKGASEGDGTDILAFNYLPNVLIFFLIYLITAVLLLLRWKKVTQLILQDGWIWLLVALATLSVLWSSDPSNTLSASIGLVGTTLFGLYLGTRYSLKELLQLLAWMYGISIVLSIIFAVALPKYGLMGGVHTGALRGIYTHKNAFGKTMSFAGVIFVLMATVNKSYRWLFWSGLVLLFILLALAGSATGLSLSLILLVSWIAYRSLKWRYERLILFLLLTLVLTAGVFMVASQTIDLLFGLVGRDTTLTGRTDIWNLVIQAIEKRPWLGYGFNAFWSESEGESAYIRRAARWLLRDPHNGFLELGLALGTLGVGIFLAGYWATLLRAVTYARQNMDASRLLPVLYLTYLLLVNITESTLLAQNTLFWVLYTAIAFSVLMVPKPTKELT